jgi:cell division protein FtsB
MWTRHHKKRRFGRLVVPAITVAFVSYFSYHSIHGSTGLKAGERFERTRVERVEELSKLRTSRIALERQVELLSDGSLERDMIDEMSRYQLNVSRPDEIVIMNEYF